jgi:hypothetical protein
MWLLLLCVHSYAEGPISEGDDPYPHLIDDDYMQGLVLRPSGEAILPDGIGINWDAPLGYTKMSLHNGTEAVISVDWNQSVFVDSTGLSVGLTPGSTKVRDATGILPPSVVPPQARIEEVLFREDQVRAGEDQVPLVSLLDIEQHVGITIAFGIGGETVYVSERFLVTADYDALAALNEAKRAESETIQACEEVRDEYDAKATNLRMSIEDSKRKRSVVRGLSVGTSALGLLIGVQPSDAVTPEEKAQSSMLGAAAIAMMAGGGILYLTTGRRADRQVESYESQYWETREALTSFNEQCPDTID